MSVRAYAVPLGNYVYYNCTRMFRFLSALAIAATLPTAVLAQGWLCYGGNPQHSGLFNGASQTASLIKWQASLDDDRAYYGDEVLIHYAAPMVTPSNTVVHGYRYTTAGPDYDNWSVIGRTGANGKLLWQMDTDFSAALIYPNDWTTVYPITLFQTSTTKRGVAAAASGGSIMVRSSADTASSASTRIAFYTTLTDFNTNKSAYAPIKINTPLTADSLGNIYFGYEVTASVPTSVASIGTGGIAKVNVLTGVTTYKSVESMGFDSSLSRPGMNAAPALSLDGNYIYVGLVGNTDYLAKLATKDLSVSAHVALIDPSNSGNAGLINQSSASPMVATDGHVFMGVFGNGWRESHGWMLQYDLNLSQVDGNGKTFPVGSFGWDDTAVVVPANIVPSYKGTAKYLILTKYNNYDDDGSDPGADGLNHVAVLDPTSNSISKDRQSGIAVMNEVLLVLGPTKTNDDSAHPDAVNEWCINSAAVDINRKGAIINSEDGHMYRWSFVTNTLVEVIDLAPATGEAYTETAIGPDGQIYVINNSIMFALGSNNATSVITIQGSHSTGTLQNIWYDDGKSFTADAVSTTSGQVVTIEADFALGKVTSPSTFTIAGIVSAGKSVTGTIFAYNNSTRVFDKLGTVSLSSAPSIVNVAVTTGAGKYVSSTGTARVRIQALQPTQARTQFPLMIDQITCGVQ